jgi:hypothetical protein
MLTPTTLISLACLLSSGQQPSQNVEITEAEAVTMENIVSSGGCLPENFEKLIQESRQLENYVQMASVPTRECMSEQ